MKRIVIALVFVVLFSLCSCGVFVDTDTEKSSELSAKYDFYKNSVSAIRSGCNVTPEEADNIFLVLVNECGVDAEIKVTPYVNAPYSVAYRGKSLTMTLDGNKVAEVFDGEAQIYPASNTPEPAGEDITETEAKPEEVEEVPARDTSIGQSCADISELGRKIVVSKVHGDVTGNWRYITLSENTDFLEYAASYYRTYFESDNEIHAVVNFANNTTTKISVLGDMLDITVYEYVDGEEHDAKLMYSGNVYSQYFVYLDNGDIEKVE